ncbi:uncharacterized protein LOC116931385 isoform X1 [Daphnia magna]|uniref:uncharacterized protein LOC116931385 isoform X1 n=1 Tax=Daphnia magna TaxID=35525 RepID=UPI001E1BD8D9|nr:uncharacterized protein LOC116931385 isoform X1 [Daphnia magna]XP_045024263.1 uncharacterized protein LOC116931385 isoform X1 [Daphnia magna]XP_045024265.1 uncharacterized protein LOC116931385 isoform X1 [Daphnia magna]
MADSIQLSALGRDALVGDFYNYFTDAILPSGIEVPNECKSISNAERKTTLSFFYQQPYKFKRHILGLNSHLFQNIENGLPDSHQPWFANYLNEKPNKDDDEKEAQVTAFFRVERRTEILDRNFMRSKMYQLRSGDRATHLVGDVIYGAELICSMRRPLNLERETKEGAEQSIYLAAKEYFNQIILGESSSIDLDLIVILEKISFTVFSSLKPGEQTEKSFSEFGQYLRKICCSDKDDYSPKWKPIDLVLISILAQVEARIWEDRKRDFAFEIERHRFTCTWNQKAISSISNHSHINRFPRFKNVINQFQNLLQPFHRKINEFYKANEPCHPEDALKQISPISILLNDINDWLAQREKEIEKFSSLTKGTQFVALDLEEIKNVMAKQDKKLVRVFHLKVEYEKDPVIDRILEVVGHQTLQTVAPLPALPFFSKEKEFWSVRSALKVFAKESQQMDGSLPGDTSCYIGLVPVSSTISNGTIKNYNSSDELLQTIHRDVSSSSTGYVYPKVTQEHKRNQQPQTGNAGFTQLARTSDHPNLSAGKETPMECDDYLALSSDSESTKGYDTPNTAEFFDPGKTEPRSERRNLSSDSMLTKDELERQLKKLKLDGEKPLAPAKAVASKIENSARDIGSPECRSNNRNLRDFSEHNTTISGLPEQRMALSQHQEKPNAAVGYGNYAHSEEIKESKLDGKRYSGVNAQGIATFGEQRRIAETFIDERTRCSERIKTGSLNIYLLNAKEKTNGDNIKWFDICTPSAYSQSSDHKIIILMGATGSGKSTLINGMINYILGVQWNDPFRFKCVREDENAARNQAHSQTSSVTAYTLHHQEGMTIPYSITIIDTPGYGDTRGVKRDKEITAAIHRFLTQQEIPIDEIHAACFVAASGDSRLTATQRYIIDSVLSIFGKDMKDNLRLLVTFADNADPPVVGACLSANFPTTSASDGIAYSKFNSSVLYCTNAKQGDDEFSFDQLFWDMGHENFKKFFYMLERMKGRDLTSTREVIHSRRQLEQSLKDIEQEMEVCLTNIENIEIFQRKMKTCGHNMEATKNFTVEQTVMRRRKLNCEKGFFAYNCEKCRKTCERRVTKKSSLHKEKRPCENQACKCPPSDHYVEEREWSTFPEKVSKTLQDMKAQYELNYDGKMTAEKILNACSDDLQMARGKVLSLLEQVAKNVDLLESTALRSNVLSPSDYLSLMRSRVQEEQAPGYMTRLETLDDIQRMLAGGTSQPIRSTAPMPNQGFRLLSSNTERVSDSSVTPSYVQAYNKEPSLPATQPTPVYGDVSESKSGRSWTIKGWPSSLFGIGKPAESDNQSQQQKKKNETWKV